MSFIQKLKKIKLHIKKTEKNPNFNSDWSYNLINIIIQLEKQPAFAKSKKSKIATERIKSLVISYKAWNPDYSPDQLIMYIDFIIEDLQSVKSGSESDSIARRS